MERLERFEKVLQWIIPFAVLGRAISLFLFFDFLCKYSDSRGVTRAVHRGLKRICADLGIDYVQFYSARHSFATIARNDCGFGKDDIAMCLNHSSGRSVTDSYIKEDFSIIERVIKEVVKFVFEVKC